MKRRAFVTGAASALVGLGATRPRHLFDSAGAGEKRRTRADAPEPGNLPGRLHQSVCR